MNSESIIQARNISRVFGTGSAAVHALKKIDISIPTRSLIALVGPSGSGKTTLMNILGILDDPTGGTVTFRNMEIQQFSKTKRDLLRRKEIGFIFQSHSLFPYLTAYENVDFAMRIAEIPASKRRNLAESILDVVGMKSRMKHTPNELSGGEQQRVAIARAIVHKPRLILADEPTAELDSKMSVRIIELFKQFIEQEGISIVMTTHDQSLLDLADQVYELEDGQIVKKK